MKSPVSPLLRFLVQKIESKVFVYFKFFLCIYVCVYAWLRWEGKVEIACFSHFVSLKFFFLNVWARGGGSAGKTVWHEVCQPDSPPGPTCPPTVQNKKCLMCVCLCVCVRGQHGQHGGG